MNLLNIFQKEKQIQYFLGVMNTSLTVDNTMLGFNYEKFKRDFYNLLKKEISDNVTIEIFEGVDNEMEIVENWANQDKDILFLPDKLKWMNYDGEGKTRNDLSIIRIDIKESVKIPLNFFNNLHELMEGDVLIEDIKISFYEYGIGVFSSKLHLNLAKDSDKFNNLSPKEFQVNLIKRIIEYPKFLEILANTDSSVNKIYNQVLAGIKTSQSPFYKNQLNMEQSVAEPLWGHILTHYNNSSINGCTLPFNEETNQFIISSHPDGLINYVKADKGYVHLGWLTSICCRLSKNKINQTLKVFKRLEFEGRFYQVLNNIIFNKLHELSSHSFMNSKIIKKNLTWIERFRIEYELFLTNRENYWSALSPFAYNIYINTRLAWRLPQQEDFFNEKLETLEVIHNQGKEMLREKSNQRLNKFILLLTIITALDAITNFLLSDISQFLIIIIPIVVLSIIAIILIYFHK